MEETEKDAVEVEILKEAGVQFPNWNQVATARRYVILNDDWVFELYGDYRQFFTVALKNLVGLTPPRKKGKYYILAFNYATPREIVNSEGGKSQTLAELNMYYSSEDNAMQAFEELRALLVYWERLRGRSPYVPKSNSVTTPAKSAGKAPTETDHVSFFERVRKWFRQNIARK